MSLFWSYAANKENKKNNNKYSLKDKRKTLNICLTVFWWTVSHERLIALR